MSNMQAIRRTTRAAKCVAQATTISFVATLAVFSMAPTASATGFSCDDSAASSYTVEIGDSWYAIAAANRVTPAQLLGANSAELSDVLLPGDRLCLPGGGSGGGACSGGSTYTIVPGDSWYGIAQRARTSARSVLAANTADTARVIHPGDLICLPAGVSVTVPTAAGPSYRVSTGDSWYGIAERSGVSVRSLLDANLATTSTLLLPGNTLRLPAGATVPSSAPAGSLASAPVRGACWFSDTWGAARSAGRSHKGVDIIAAEGTHVRAVVDGRLTHRAWDQPGKRAGNAWTLTGADGTYYFYGHLLDFAPGLKVGSTVKAGEIIGFVGETGNATTPHLHLEIHPRGGSAVNPYQAVLAMGECRRAIG